MKPLSDLEQKLGYEFKDKAWLEQALTHDSYRFHGSNERLEFLGDSSYKMVVSQYLFEQKLPKKACDLLRHHLVNNDTLAVFGKQLGLDVALRHNSTEGVVPSMIAGACEALIGAMWIDGGREPVTQLVYSMITQAFASNVEAITDHVQLLRDYLNQNGKESPRFMTRHVGRGFRAVLELEGTQWAGYGRTTSDAQDNAATAACKAFGLTLALNEKTYVQELPTARTA